MDPSFFYEYETARAVGYRVDQLDSYFFPCESLSVRSVTMYTKRHFRQA